MKVDYCPKCGQVGYLEVTCKKHNDKEYCYYRVVHYYYYSGGRRKRTCYLGPVNREYIYVEKVHKLGLTNLLHQDVIAIVHNAVSSFIDRVRNRAKKKNADIAKLIRDVEKLKELLDKLKSELATLLEELKSGVEQ
jgi:hypothetical protein